MNNGAASPTTRYAAHLMTVAVIAFAAICGAAQFWRTDLDPIAVPLSIYLTGPGGAYVRMTYYLMGIALIFFAVSSYRATAVPLRSGLALVLFAVPGLLLPIVAATELFKDTPYEGQAALIHGLAAQSTFLTLSFGMLLLSSRWRRDPRLRASRYLGVSLAWLATAILWLQTFMRTLPHGLMQKLLIVLILLWLAWAARQLLRAARPRYAGV
ncbi:DUF998 domain-containing protein [Dyella nitratireducens]|uniref:DUF998 domain-containing protein n=1 Tax=Dyella nitratireducens TaxID=1849580 RepID=A0ABQ1GHE5_9GAMM|nr:DUF998 domain-containing protein [Dyella nitratireducens]GGA43941.1 hypothetical protein GCM10010981_36330 [Dyella nitratireducens]GLQ41810.1 hypothetical protein GCM10007902_16600 [Dyella nitratireducens]